jgi:hypothetical protein
MRLDPSGLLKNAVAFLLLLLSAAHWQRAQACAGSGYCSEGKVGVYHGDITSSEALRAMVEKVAYKKELIFTILTDNLSFAIPIIHMWLNIHNLGCVWGADLSSSCGCGPMLGPGNCCQP